MMVNEKNDRVHYKNQQIKKHFSVPDQEHAKKVKRSVGNNSAK